MDQNHQVKGVSPCGEHEIQTKAQRTRKKLTTNGPGPSCKSYKSDQLIQPETFKQGPSSDSRTRNKLTTDGPGPSCVSYKSDDSMGLRSNFKRVPSTKPQTRNKFATDGPGPGPSCVSYRSEDSMGLRSNFKGVPSNNPQTRNKFTTDGPGPGPSCVSYKSDDSMGLRSNFKGVPSNNPQTRKKLTTDGPGPGPSGVSYKSEDSMGLRTNFKVVPSTNPQTRKKFTTDGPGPSCVSYKSDDSMGLRSNFKGVPSNNPHLHQPSLEDLDGSFGAETDSIFTLLEDNIISFVKAELKHMQKIVDGEDPESQMEDKDEVLRSSREAFLNITLNFLKRMKQDDLAERLQSRTRPFRCQRDLKSNLKKKFRFVSEGVAKAGSPTLLKEIFTELYITEGGSGEVNQEHEVRQIETASRRSDAAETAIRLEELFKVPPGRPRPIRTVMTKGVAGIGKTLLTHKFTVDWAEDKAQQEVHFTFPLTFRELNLLRGRSFSLVGLVHHFFSETKGAGIGSFQNFLVLFILDGLDECRLTLDFLSTETLTDASESTSVEVLLINLIRGKLLPSALLWITTRPAAANQIPPECVDMVTEVRGFTDPQKEEYFRRRSTDEEQFSRIMSHIRTCHSLHIMCHIPLFCWITATVLEDVLKSREEGELPTTLSQIYNHFIVLQTKVKKVKFDGGAATDPHWSPENREMMLSLAKLAFEQLQKGNQTFYESDLTECGMDLRTGSVCSGVFTQVFREESRLYQDKVYTFIHLSLQEFLAALHVHQTFISSKVNLLEPQQPQTFNTTLNILHQSAVDEALRSPNGHLDLFLRFLLGLSLPTNQKLLQGLLTQTGSSSQSKQETVEYIKKKLDESQSVERSINLLHCLNELNDRSLLEQIQRSMRSEDLNRRSLSPAQWSALVFILLSSEEHLDVFDLQRFFPSENGFLNLFPVIKASKKAVLSGCGLSERNCAPLSSVLSSQSSSLKHLDLSNNRLQDSGVNLLCKGLKTPHCKLDSLRLSRCGLSERSCAALSSVLSSQFSSLKHLDLNTNQLQDSGVELLCEGLMSPHCKLDSLSLSGCLITEVGCTSLTAALSSNSASVRELDLSYNHPGDSAVKLLSSRLEDPQHKLQTLRVEPGGEQYLKADVRKYFCHIQLDKNSINTNLRLSDNNRTMTRVKKKEEEEEQDYPDHQHRFDYWYQILCSTGLTGRCYWEVEWSGSVDISVSYRGISRKGEIYDYDSTFGFNDQSWSLKCSKGFYCFIHDKKETDTSCPCPASGRVGVYVDCPAGHLSFYEVSSDSLRHIYSVSTSFAEPPYPGFRFDSSGSSVSLCPL